MTWGDTYNRHKATGMDPNDAAFRADQSDPMRKRRAEIENERLREALIQADLKIRSFAGADQSDVEFIREALGKTPSPEPNVACPCTLIEQDEDCPVGYPSMLCGVCNGTGNTTQEQVTALACEMIKIASDIGGPEDPFAAWESIDLIKSQNEMLRKVLERAAIVAECHSDDRPGRDRPFDWNDGYIDGCRGAAAAIRALKEGSNA